MGFFGKIKNTVAAVAPSAPAPTNGTGKRSISTAQTELARNTLSSKKRDPLLVESDSDSSESQKVVEQQTTSELNHFDKTIMLESEAGSSQPPSHPDSEPGRMVPRNAIPPPHQPSRTPISTATETRKIISTQSEETAYKEMSGGSLPNPETLVMGQLVQWRFAAEEGSIMVHIPAVLGSLGLMVTTVIPLALDPESRTAGHGIVTAYVFLLGTIICIIDGRFSCVRNPLGSRAKIRNSVIRHCNILKKQWGRGLLYCIAGILNIAHETTYCYISGGIMVLLGILAIIVGYHASKNLSTLRKAVSNEEFLFLKFVNYDFDGDGYLNSSEFAQFIWGLGLEFDDLYTLKAFTTIDTDHDGRLSFREFMRWWSQIRVDSTKQSSSGVNPI